MSDRIEMKSEQKKEEGRKSGRRSVLAGAGMFCYVRYDEVSRFCVCSSD